MSVAECEEDEPDPCLCELHGRPYPCQYCRFDAMEARAEMEREERDYEHGSM